MARGYPKLCRRKGDGRYYATDPATRKPTYFGREAVEAKRLYDLWIAKLAARRAAPPRPTGPDPAVKELCAAFLETAKAKYVKRGRTTRTYRTFIQAIRFLTAPFGDTPASAFSADELLSVRDAMLAHRKANGRPYDRGHVNAQIGRLVLVFRWGRRRRIVPREVVADLADLEPLGRGEAPDNPPVLPVPLADVLATAAVCRDKARAMILLQLHSGARPGEVCAIRAEEIDRSSTPWVYRPSEWKTEHHGGGPKLIYLGPQARAVLEPVLKLHPAGYLFPARGSNGLRHTSESCYWQSVKLAAARAGVPHFFPHQIRHLAATTIRAGHGLEAAQSILGHETRAVTERYALKDDALARRVAEESG